MALRQNTFDGGTHGVTITDANSGGGSGTPFNNVEITPGATITYDSGAALHAGLGARLTGNGAGVFVQHDFTTNTKLTARFHVRFPSIPSVNCQLYTPRSSIGYIGGLNITTALKFQVTKAGGASIFTSAALSTNTWYRVEIAHEIGTATTGKIWFRYFLGNNATAVEEFTSTTADLGTTAMYMYRLGKINSSGNTPMDLDSVSYNDGSTAYLGPHTQLAVPPVADAGLGSSDVEPGKVVTLDGSGSYDPDGTITSYVWSQTNGVTVPLSGTSSVKTFTAPYTIAGSVLGFKLTVTDSTGLTASASVAHAVLPATERAAVNGTWAAVRTATL